MVRSDPSQMDPPWDETSGQVRLAFGQMRYWVRLTFGQMYPLRWDFRSGQVDIWSDEIQGHVNIWSDVPPKDETWGQVDIWSDGPPHKDETLAQVRLTFGQMRGRVSLTFGQMYPHHPWDETWCQVDIWSDGWLAGQLQLTCWLVGHLTKCHLCIDVKNGHPSRSELGSGWYFVRWLANHSWLAGHLTKCQPDPPGSDFGLCWYFVRWDVGQVTFGQMYPHEMRQGQVDI